MDIGENGGKTTDMEQRGHAKKSVFVGPVQGVNQTDGRPEAICMGEGSPFGFTRGARGVHENGRIITPSLYNRFGRVLVGKGGFKLLIRTVTAHGNKDFPRGCFP